jgi:hypothetical protein
MDRRVPTEQVLNEMRQSNPPIHYLVGTPKGRLTHRTSGPWGTECARDAGIQAEAPSDLLTIDVPTLQAIADFLGLRVEMLWYSPRQFPPYELQIIKRKILAHYGVEDKA